MAGCAAYGAGRKGVLGEVMGEQGGAWDLDRVEDLHRLWPFGAFRALAEPFRARVLRRRLPSMVLEGIEASPYRVERTGRTLREQGGHRVVVSAILLGEADIVRGSERLTARPGDVFVHRGAAFEYACRSDSVTFRAVVDADTVYGVRGQPAVLFDLIAPSTLSSAFVRFAHEVLRSVADEPVLLARSAQRLEQALIVLQRALLEELAAARGDAVDQTSALRLRCQEWIELHLTDTDLTSERIAKAMAVSRRRLFQVFEGQPESLYQSIRRRRIEVAAGLLQQTPWITTSELAAAVGFAGAEGFSRSFRAVEGVSVAAYRAALKEARPS